MQRPRDDDQGDENPTKLVRAEPDIFLRDMIKMCSINNFDEDIHEYVRSMSKSVLISQSKLCFLSKMTGPLLNSLKIFIIPSIDYDVIVVPRIECELIGNVHLVLPTEILKLDEFLTESVSNDVDASRIVFDCTLEYKDQPADHSNVCILDHQKKTFVHFEPHGATSFRGKDPVRVVFKELMFKLLPDYEFIDQEVYCPDPVQDDEPYCAFWSCLFAYLHVILDLTTQQTISVITSWGKNNRLLIVENFMHWLWECVEYTDIQILYHIFESVYQLAADYDADIIHYPRISFRNQVIEALLDDPEDAVDGLRELTNDEVELYTKSVEKVTELRRHEHVYQLK